MISRLARARARWILSTLVMVVALPLAAYGQQTAGKAGDDERAAAARSSSPAPPDPAASAGTEAAGATISRYVDRVQGESLDELIRRALAASAELAAARLDIERARARLRQSRLRANPTIEFEQTTGQLTGSAGERDTSIGLTLPLELNGQRQRRADLARAELEAAQAEVADRERRAMADVRAAYAEALAASRELALTESSHRLDVQTARLVEARVTEGESAPLELNLLRAEVERLKSRRALVEGRLRAALLRLKSLAGIGLDEPLRLREDLATAELVQPPVGLAALLDIALRTRPDLRLARLNEKVAEAGLELARARGRPELSAFTRFSTARSTFDKTPLGALRDTDRVLSFGVSVSLPLFNRNQGARAEAATAIIQAKRKREFAEQVVRAEVASAYARYEAAQSAVAIFEQGVLARATQNLQSMRGAYELGAFRMTELLAEQRRLMDSQREYTEALTERYKAMADLLFAIAAPPKEE
jgi:cobalt-zinc-cadmium efflux system outer membrane protein